MRNLLLIFIILNSFNTAQASSSLFKGLERQQNLIEAGYEYYLKSTFGIKVINLTQDTIFISNKRGKIFEVDPKSFFNRFPSTEKSVWGVIIIGVSSGAALNKSLTGLCSSCNKTGTSSYCGESSGGNNRF